MASVIDASREVVVHHWPGIFRSTLFLASMMVVLDHFYWFEWLNAVMFRAISTIAQHHDEPNRTEPVKALVFTIQEELFETEFRSSSPIDRSMLIIYLEKLVKVYPEFNVLAIDYDLSPNNYNLSHYEKKHECIISNAEEQRIQNELDGFLENFARNGKKVVLINHIPVQNSAICECKIKWEQRRYNQGVLFGKPDILHYGVLGPVMKYVKGNNTFPDVVSAAEKLADKKSKYRLPLIQGTCDNEPASLRQFGSKTFKPINFFSNGAVKAYGLGGLKDLRFYRNDLGEKQAKEVKVIFFGGNYGRDDIYATPIGERPGVTIHAYTYYSIADKAANWARENHGLVWVFDKATHWVRENHGLAWIFDIVLGLVTGLIFHIIWRLFHDYRLEGAFALQVGLVVVNFIVLGGILFALVYWFAQLLVRGLWLSPGAMLIGLFIDSYVASVTSYEASPPASHKGGGHDAHGVCMGLISNDLFIERSVKTGFTCLLRQLFGVPDSDMRWWNLLIYGILKIAVFWMVIGIAVYIILTDH